MNILCIYKEWARGGTPYVADGVFDGKITEMLFSNFSSKQEIIEAVESPYYPMKIDKIVIGLTARNAIFWDGDFEGCEVVIPAQKQLIIN